MDVAVLVVNSITIITVLLLGGWILRLYGERERTMKESQASQQQNWESQKTLLEERLTSKDDELEKERRHIQQMADLNQASEKLLERQLQDVQRMAGIDPEAPLSATPRTIPAEVRQNMLEILGQLKDIRTVVSQLAPGATTAPLGVTDHLLRAGAYYTAGQYEQALAALDRALELRPDDADTLYNRGTTLIKLGRHDDALAELNRALELGPDDPQTLYNRACLFSLWDRPDEALEDLRRAIAGHGKYREKARSDPDFDSIPDDPRFRELVGEDEPPPETEAPQD